MDSRPSPSDGWNAHARRLTCRRIILVNVPMKNPDDSQLIDKALRLHIDRDAWLELSIQCSRAVASLGVVGTVLTLAERRSEEEQLKSFVAIKEVCIEAHLTLKKFANLWASLDEQALNESVQFSPEELGRLRNAGRQSPILERRLKWSDTQSRIVRHVP
jgi:hypothetical protein